MSLLIKGMCMPEVCDVCTFMEYNGSGGLICSLTGSLFEHGEEMSGRPCDCPLVEIKPNVRLVEDTVLDNMSMWNTSREYDRGWDSAVRCAKGRLKSAPAVVEY